MNLDGHIDITKDVINSPNLVELFSPRDRQTIANKIWDGFRADLASRDKWEKRTQAGMDLALQLSKAKNFPWPGCSNVAFPLVTIAALQFHSRAYPALVQAPDIVRCRVVGQDPTGEQSSRAARIGRHMSWQVLEQDIAWEEQHDRLFINVPIVGCAFVKTFHDGVNRSELVMAQDLVLNYYAKSVEACPRKTQRIPKFKNEIYEGVHKGIYIDVLDEAWFKVPQMLPQTPGDMRNDQRDGMLPPPADEDTPFMTLEQHCLLDLDGDGYAEPYIATIEETSKCLLRLVTRFDRMEDVHKDARGRILSITPMEYYTKYSFIPSPDGGIYDLGFGVLLGPLNEASNSIINQLVDAGTMANTAGGFLGRGAKIRGGSYTFAPLEWKRVDSTGEDLQKSIFPLPVREPSNVLFQLLSLIINYTGRISGTTDTLVGENPGQNTPAQTTQAMVEQGMKIYNAVFKRMWRSMKEEFKKLYILNGLFMPEFSAFGSEGEKALHDDYMANPDLIVPLADPNVASEQDAIRKAMALKQLAQSTPGYNLKEVEHRVLQALRIDNPELVYPGPDKIPPPTNPKVQIEQLKLQAKQAQLEWQQKQFLFTLQEEHAVNEAKIVELQASATKLLAEAKGVDTGHQLAMINSMIAMVKARNSDLHTKIDLALKAMELHHDINSNPIQGMGRSPSDAGAQGASPGPGGQPQVPMGGGPVY